MTGEDLSAGQHILFVRITSNLGQEELIRRMSERFGSFDDVHGLVEKRFGLDEETGDICGAYVFEDRPSLDAYLSSPLAQAIAQTYEATEVRREVYANLHSVTGTD